MKFYIIHALMHNFKCQISLNEIFLSRLNILGVGDSTGTVGFSPLAMLYQFLTRTFPCKNTAAPQEPESLGLTTEQKSSESSR